jgi:glycosyltransferase involved in cell wall biosynthesis
LKVLLALENHFYSDPGGQVFGDGPANYAIWSRYLEIFDEVALLARVSSIQESYSADARADGPAVSFYPLPDYIGPWQYLKRLPELKAIARRAITQCDAYILRMPGLVGRLAWQEIARLQKPYALDVVGDPWDALGPGSLGSILRPIFRHVGVHDLSKICQGAVAVHYLTENVLQRRYPPAKNAYAVGFSDILMDFSFAPPEGVEGRYRRIENLAATSEDSKTPIRIGFIGSLARMYKGPDVLLRAGQLCRSRGLNFEIAMVGAGRHLEEMQVLAKRLGIQDQTRFLGQLPSGEPIFDFLDSVDLFVLPSRAEGLPRALLEAMARGCPCIGSTVGGIPELLEPADIVSIGDAAGLADKIMEVSGNPLRMKEMARRNLEKARTFSPEHLKNARRDFFRYVRLHSEAQKQPA